MVMISESAMAGTGVKDFIFYDGVGMHAAEGGSTTYVHV